LKEESQLKASATPSGKKGSIVGALNDKSKQFLMTDDCLSAGDSCLDTKEPSLLDNIASILEISEREEVGGVEDLFQGEDMCYQNEFQGDLPQKQDVVDEELA
jgi:hypothetical protein